MWALDVTGGNPAELNHKLLSDKNEYVRGWAVQLAIDHPQANLAELLPQLSTMAQHDPSPVVRLYLASAMQRIPVEHRWEILAEPRRPRFRCQRPQPAVHALVRGRTACERQSRPRPRVRTLLRQNNSNAPRIHAPPHRQPAIKTPASPSSSAASCNPTTPTNNSRSSAAFAPHSPVNAAQKHQPVGPPPTTSSPRAVTLNCKSEANALGVTFGDAAAMESLRSLVASPNADVEPRRNALKTLLAAKDPKLAVTLQSLLADQRLRDAALTGLALYDDPHTPAKILAAYSQLNPNEKRAALSTLASRIPYGLDLMKAVSAQQIPAKDLSADLVRQLHNLKDESIDKMIGDVWGQIRTTPADKAALIESYRKQVTAKDAADSDPALGRAVFTKTCQQCHTLYGIGTNIGPDLTGSNRSDVEYLLSNIVDPSAVIAKEYRPTIVVSTDGRVITGIVAGEDDKSLTLRTATETVVLPKDEIDERTVSDTSMMPDDQLKQFSTAEVLSLVRVPPRQTASAAPGHQRKRGKLLQRQRPHRLER